MRYFVYFLLLLLVAYLLTGVTFVQPGERAVVRRFGRVLEHKPGPGLHIGFPWGIDRVDRVAVDSVQRITVGYREQTVDSTGLTLPPGQFLTGDQNLVNIAVVLDYSVREDGIESYVVQRERIEGLLSRAAETALFEWMAGRGVDDILLRGKAELPGWLIKRTQEHIQPYAIGVQIQAVSVAELTPPAEVQDDFERVNQAKANKAQQINQANAEADILRSKAESEKITIENKTDTSVNRKLKRAEENAQRFEERLKKNQQALQENRTRFLTQVWQNEMTDLLSKMKGKVHILDHDLAKDGLDLTTVVPLPKK